MEKQSRSAAPRRPSRSLLGLFGVYLAWYMRRHFHGIRISGAERLRRDGDGPLVVFLNHASWWDPLTCISVARALMPGAEHYAPMDADALAHYGFFRRLGMFPIEVETPRGAVQFLRTSEAILAQPNRVLWVTPQGKFADARVRPAELKPGVGALAARLAASGRGGTFVPLAIEYTYWNERLPEILLRCGEPVHFSGGLTRAADVESDMLATDAATDLLAAALMRTQDELAVLSVARDAAPFTTIAAGGAGVGGVYSMWQRLRARAGGRRYIAEHDAIKQDVRGG